MTSTRGKRSSLFQVVEIEVSLRCNLKCSYCPQSYNWFRGPEHKMETQRFLKIVSELKELNFAGRLSFHMYNEPLLRKDLSHLVRIARESLPLAWLVIYTNGDILTDDRYTELIESGVDRFLVTRHRGAALPPRPFQEQRFPGDFMLSNRAGLMRAVECEGTTSNLPCYAPTEMLMIRHHGAVVLCHEDAADQSIMGHVDSQTIEEIWFSKKFILYRSALESGERGCAAEICAKCNNRLHPLPDTAI